MTDLEFMDRAEQLLLAVEQCCDRINDNTDADIDSQRMLIHVDQGTRITVMVDRDLEIF